MAGPTPMMNALSSLGAPPAGPPSLAPPGAAPMAPGAAPPIPSATGAPPPLGIGKIPTGTGGASPKVSAGTAINSLRDLKAQFPNSSDEIEAMIAQIRQYASGSSEATKKPGDDATDAA